MRPISRVREKANVPKSIKKYINKLKPYSGGEWDNKHQQLNDFKVRIKAQLLRIQKNRCAYCGLKFGETSNPEIEHIAPKGGTVRPKYTKFVFTPYNLVLACHLCNSPNKKGQYDSIDRLDINYKLCKFRIVHPYFDDPDDHYDWVPQGSKILITKKTDKGQNSIEIFELDSVAHTEARAKLIMYEDQRQQSDEFEIRLKKILDYK